MLIKIKLRDGSTAHLKPLTVPDPVLGPNEEPFRVEGFDKDGNPSLWTSSGRWAYDGREHPLDIVRWPT